jgi:hypothetical protein
VKLRRLALAGAIGSILLAGGAAGGAAGVAGAAASTPAPRGTVSVLALVGRPGFPALPHVLGDRVYEGTYDDPTGDEAPSRVFEYSTTGQLLKTFVVQGQDLSQPHGVQVAANDSRGRLLLLDKTSGRIIRLDPTTGAQTLYSQVPQLPPCSTAAPGAACKPALLDLAPMPDYAAWGPDGSLYITDYQQALIWRIPPGGGKAQIWLSSRQLDGTLFGTACVAMMPDHRTLLFDQASNGGLGYGNPTTGKLYEVPIEPNGKPGSLHQLWESGGADAPDGCAIARSGHIYLALVGASNQIVELDSSGHELTRFGQQYTGTNNSSVPFDSPSGLAWLGTDLLIANQSYFADNAANQAVLELQTGEAGQPTYVPAGAGLAPKPKAKPKAKHKKHHKPKKHKKRRRRRK